MFDATVSDYLTWNQTTGDSAVILEFKLSVQEANTLYNLAFQGQYRGGFMDCSASISSWLKNIDTFKNISGSVLPGNLYRELKALK